MNDRILVFTAPIDAKAVNVPILDRMYKEYPPGKAPERLAQLAGKISDADGVLIASCSEAAVFLL